jgi:hypothetical protein
MSYQSHVESAAGQRDPRVVLRNDLASHRRQLKELAGKRRLFKLLTARADRATNPIDKRACEVELDMLRSELGEFDRLLRSYRNLVELVEQYNAGLPVEQRIA